MKQLKAVIMFIAFVILILISYVMISEFLEPRVYNIMTAAFSARSKGSDGIVIVVIDDKSIEKYRWPWSRDKYAKIFNFLGNYADTKVIGFDSVLTSNDDLIKDKKFYDTIKNIDNFVGDYACVYKGSLEGWGIINKKFEWVIKPEYKAIEGEIHPKLGTEIKGFVTKYTYLHNINGKLFIASRNHGEEFIMDINGDIQIPHVAKKFYYQYIEDKLYFIAVDKDTTVFINQNGKKFLQLDFKIGEKFWLFEEIIIVSKDEKYGIIDWKGKILIDFIFSDIKPEENNLDFIPVKYLDMWGYINKKGKVINMKIKDMSKADEKCSKVELWKDMI